jgi:hypothetical protein
VEPDESLHQGKADAESALETVGRRPGDDLEDSGQALGGDANALFVLVRNRENLAVPSSTVVAA